MEFISNSSQCSDYQIIRLSELRYIRISREVNPKWIQNARSESRIRTFKFAQQNKFKT